MHFNQSNPDLLDPLHGAHEGLPYGSLDLARLDERSVVGQLERDIDERADAALDGPEILPSFEQGVGGLDVYDGAVEGAQGVRFDAAVGEFAEGADEEVCALLADQPGDEETAERVEHGEAEVRPTDRQKSHRGGERVRSMMQRIRFQHGGVFLTCDLERRVVQPFLDRDREECEPHRIGIQHPSTATRISCGRSVVVMIVQQPTFASQATCELPERLQRRRSVLQRRLQGLEQQAVRMESDPHRTRHQHQTHPQRTHRLVLAIPERMRCRRRFLRHLPAEQRHQIRKHVRQAVRRIRQQRRRVEVHPGDALGTTQPDVGYQTGEGDIGTAVSFTLECGEELIRLFGRTVVVVVSVTVVVVVSEHAVGLGSDGAGFGADGSGSVPLALVELGFACFGGTYDGRRRSCHGGG
ncbi:Carboxylesterase [Pseudozyma hubeiensis]|nr:Carboxylesterase [Pseudozyma hubeiensis]